MKVMLVAAAATALSLKIGFAYDGEYFAPPPTPSASIIISDSVPRAPERKASPTVPPVKGGRPDRQLILLY
jgi:hypothetical protein